MDEYVLVMDDREDLARRRHLMAMPGFASFTTRLPVGDYLLLGKNCIEFKTISDLISSVYDGRIWQQCSEMFDTYGGGYVVIEGTFEQARDANPKWRYDRDKWGKIEDSIRGAILSIMEQPGIKVLFVRDLREFGDWLIAMGKRLTRPERSGGRKIVTHKGRDRTLQQEADDAICSLSGLGRSASKELLSTFGTLRGVLNAEKADLVKVDGIGKVLAEHLLAVATAPHKAETPVEATKSQPAPTVP